MIDAIKFYNNNIALWENALITHEWSRIFHNFLLPPLQI